MFVPPVVTADAEGAAWLVRFDALFVCWAIAPLGNAEIAASNADPRNAERCFCFIAHSQSSLEAYCRTKYRYW